MALRNAPCERNFDGLTCRNRQNLNLIAMKTQIFISKELVEKAQEVAGVDSPEAAVEIGLRNFVRLNDQKQIRNWRGKLHWEGDLDQMRQ